MNSKTNWYWQHHGTNQSVLISTSTIVRPCLDLSVINNGADIPKSTRYKKLHQDVQRQPICIADTDHEYIIDKIEICDHIEYKIKYTMMINNNCI